MVAHDPNIEDVRIQAGAATLTGELALPDHPSGMVVVARQAPEGGAAAREIAAWFGQVGLGTLQVDLISPDDAAPDGDAQAYETLTARWVGVVDWLTDDDRTASRPIGLFGLGVASASALTAAAERPQRVAAVVTAGGHPEAAGDRLRDVAAPTLLIASEGEAAPEGGEPGSLRALSGLTALSRREMVPAAPEEDAAALEEAAAIARDWFAPYLVAPDASAFEAPEMDEDEAVRRKG